MTINTKMILTLIGGTALGGAVIQTLHAQAKPPTYVVVAIRKINDAEGFKTGVVDKASPAVLEAAGGHYVIRSQKSPPSMEIRPNALSSSRSTARRRRKPGTIRQRRKRSMPRA